MILLSKLSKLEVVNLSKWCHGYNSYWRINISFDIGFWISFCVVEYDSRNLFSNENCICCTVLWQFKITILLEISDRIKCYRIWRKITFWTSLSFIDLRKVDTYNIRWVMVLSRLLCARIFAYIITVKAIKWWEFLSRLINDDVFVQISR